MFMGNDIPSSFAIYRTIFLPGLTQVIVLTLFTATICFMSGQFSFLTIPFKIKLFFT